MQTQGGLTAALSLQMYTVLQSSVVYFLQMFNALTPEDGESLEVCEYIELCVLFPHTDLFFPAVRRAEFQRSFQLI